MKALALSLFSLVLLTGADAPTPTPRQLNPEVPADAVEIVNVLTRQIALPRDQAMALTVAIDTLRNVVAPPITGGK